MGGCVSQSLSDPDSYKNDNAISGKLRALEDNDSAMIKILLLGAAESGKSTIFKQMKILYGNKNVTQAELNSTRRIIHDNIIVTMQTILDYVELFGYKGLMREENVEMYEQIMKGRDDETLTTELGLIVRTLWTDPSVMMVWVRRSETQLVESIEYFVKHIDRIADKTYMNKPHYTKEELKEYNMDILRARVPTKGIVTEHYTIDGKRFEMYDVCGQRTERRKWIGCFNGVTAVIFVAALPEYDQKLCEDLTTNRMLEALELFGQVVNNDHFQETALILFLNKRDLFETKITRLPIKNTPEFSDYKGGSKYSAACEYFENRFVHKVANNRVCYVHITCATDTTNVRIVFEQCKSIIIASNMRDADFL